MTAATHGQDIISTCSHAPSTQREHPVSDSVAKDARAKELGDWLFAWRQKRGLSRPETIAEALKHDPRASISPDYLSKLEYGLRSLASASLDVREALRLALGIKREVWEEETGLLVPASYELIPDSPNPSYTSRSRALSAGAKYGSRYGDLPRRREIEVPDALREAAEQYGHLPLYRGIGERHWQQFMLTASRKATPQDVEGWLREFSDLKRMGYDPKPEDFE
ncbi:hypothetical protein [Deinococcus irradiatisoli]|uniref:hypothetical protein n=1 Tax=Deinococcus irradiatisoli TaxID=2202254 RepID=UPI0015E85DF9|nr:hypothetical protein [Deinococcus irradiatisoli]